MSASMQQAMADLAGNFSFVYPWFNRSAARFQSMANDMAQGLNAGLLIDRQNASVAAQGLAQQFQFFKFTIAGNTAALTESRKELPPAPMPGPFLQLKTESIEIFVKESLRVDVAGNEPALLSAKVKGWLLGGVNNAARQRAAREPSKVVRVQEKKPFTIGFF